MSDETNTATEAEKQAPTEEPKQEAPKRGGRKPKGQEPKPARIVMYVTASETIRPAIITRVNDNGSVDLSVFNSEGCVAVQRSFEAPAEDMDAGTWHWPQID